MVKKPSHSTGLRVHVLPVDGFALMSYAALVEPMRAANLLAERPCFEVTHLTLGERQAISSGGVLVPGLPITSNVPDFDILFVIAGSNAVEARLPELMGFLRRVARHGKVIGGVSAGPVLLARAGLLTGRRMTVHWDHMDLLKQVYPDLLLERTLYVIDRDRMTCAGGTAPVDLMHAIIAGQWGPDMARKVTDWFVHAEIRPSAGPQRAGRVERYGTTNPTLLSAIEIMESHISDPVSLEVLASIVGISQRQLSRLFRGHLGKSPMEFCQDLRLDTARNLLERSALSLTDIAFATGFSNSSHFATRFRRKFGVPPSVMRRTGQPDLPDPGAGQG